MYKTKMVVIPVLKESTTFYKKSTPFYTNLLRFTLIYSVLHTFYHVMIFYYLIPGPYCLFSTLFRPRFGAPKRVSIKGHKPQFCEDWTWSSIKTLVLCGSFHDRCLGSHPRRGRSKETRNKKTHGKSEQNQRHAIFQKTPTKSGRIEFFWKKKDVLVNQDDNLYTHWWKEGWMKDHHFFFLQREIWGPTLQSFCREFFGSQSRWKPNVFRRWSVSTRKPMSAPGSEPFFLESAGPSFSPWFVLESDGDVWKVNATRWAPNQSL